MKLLNSVIAIEMVTQSYPHYPGVFPIIDLCALQSDPIHTRVTIPTYNDEFVTR